MTPSQERVRIRFRGAVQGVGFRPFLHGLAVRHGISGFVLNDADGVLAEIEGTSLNAFMTTLSRERPPLARIDVMDITRLPLERQHGFAIRESEDGGDGSAQAGADAVTCGSCLEELFDPASRFHLYPFVTCTNCGPRFSMMRRVPYDRANTSMAAFAPCKACAADYANPASRRFHAEAIACPACGPSLSHAIEDIANALLDGKIVAVKGIGGFHLLCDATNDNAVQLLRIRKLRPHKPLAVMVASAACAELMSAPSEAERALLRHVAGPIVMVQRGEGLAPSVAPGLCRVGLMLPTAPVHHLIFQALRNESAKRARHVTRPAALVATSANRAGEPLVIDNDVASRTLSEMADLVVTHDRAIVARADDSVMAIANKAAFFIRRSRGFVPDPIDLGHDGPPVLGVGGQLKATLCITRGREAFVSQHFGDLGSADTVRFYHETARRMLAMLGTTPALAVCDLHPDYVSTLFAEASDLPLLRVQHHAAHLAAVAAEHHLTGDVLGVALDGHGLGDDGGSWGGELMTLHGARWHRRGHLTPLPLPGGERAAREPWRMGVAALSALGRSAEAAARFAGIEGAARLAALLRSDTRGPTTTSMGRLFDAAAALLGVCMRQTYEGQAAMELEALVGDPICLPEGYRITDNILDFTPLLNALLASGIGPRTGANLFHGTLIAGLAAWIAQNAAHTKQTNIILGGGCFANRVLTEGLVAALAANGLVAWLPRAVPANDGGLSLGQAAMGRAYLEGGRSSASFSQENVSCV
jgi:hydrogenase maturation protein HypF